VDISFPTKSAYDFSATGIAFPVIVDGYQRRCLVTEEALMDHFGATGIDPAHLQEAFEANRDRIEAVAEARIRGGATGEVLLRSRDF
jgi:hypothetical protein